MDLKDTIDMMTSVDHQQRFKAEYDQTKIRRDRLYRMVESYASDALGFTPKCPVELLMDQIKAMDKYLFILLERAKIEGIDLTT